jgi:hypothetical protein
VSRSNIESHYGRLSAAPNEGPGATFFFTLPRAFEPPNEVARPGRLATASTSSDIRAQGMA